MTIRTLLCSAAVASTLMLGVAPAVAATPSKTTAAKSTHRVHKARTAATPAGAMKTGTN